MSFIRPWIKLIKPGDVLVLILSSLLATGLFLNALSKPAGTAIIVRAQGKAMVRTSLERDAYYKVPGKLGLTIVEIRHGQARVASDPGPRQICVKQGWVSRSGDAALCLANQTSLEIVGQYKPFDSKSY